MAFLRKRFVLIAVLVFLGLLFVPTIASAETAIKITIRDPDSPINSDLNQAGNTVYRAISSPQVSFGENIELGTLRTTGKPGIAIPVAQGQKIQITLPLGISYMQVPTAENYRNYVEWPASIDGQGNQIVDRDGKPGMKFLSASPRTLTLQLENLDASASVMVLDFVFNKHNYSTVRISRMLEEVENYKADPNGSISRLDFFKLMVDVSLPFTPARLNTTAVKSGWEANFTDLKNLPAVDLNRISPLLEGGFVNGYPGGQLLAGQTISRAEAISLVGRVFAYAGKRPSFSDLIPAWAETGIDSAVNGGIVSGYSDGSFQPERLLSKAEALSIAQNCLESYSKVIVTK